MKTFLYAMSLLACSTNVFAQLSTLPPSSLVDGVVVSDIGLNAGDTHWDSPATLGIFKTMFATDGDTPLTSCGLTFGSALSAAFLAEKNRVNLNGGTIRAIFLGETAGWGNAFGYTYSGLPQGPDSFTAWGDIDKTRNVSFGSSFDINMGVGGANAFDFWYNSMGCMGTAPSTVAGGVYTVFSPGGSSPRTPSGNVLYLQTPLMVSTWIPALGVYQDVATYVVGFEDSRADNPIDHDYSDLIVGFQIFIAGGRPLDAQPIPEPSTYAGIGASGLLALAAFRSWRRDSHRVRS